MIHFLYLIGFAFFVSTAFAVFFNGETQQKIVYGVKIFAQFFIVSLILGWLFYLIT